jgi:penicillin-binding protein 2
MSARSHGRLMVVHVLVVTLMLVLAGRLWTLQVMNGAHYAQVAAENRIRDIVVPAVRGQILDDVGRPLGRNRSSLVVSVDINALRRLPDGGKAVLTRLAKVLNTSYDQLALKIRLCAPTVKRPCWPGSPYQPIPVNDKADPRVALQIMERQEEFPGVIAQIQPVREYPGNHATQTLGYLQPITQEELDKNRGLKVTGFSGVDLVGRDGLEAQYDGYLRGVAGIRRVMVDSQGRVTGTAKETPAQAGSHLVTSIDAKVQAAAETALKHAVANAHNLGNKGDSAAAVVLDVKTGRVVALASLPSYDPSVWTGGISQAKYDALLGKGQGEPLISRATQGQFAPGSTFKISSLPAAIKDGYNLHATYDCPGSYNVGSRAFTNFEGQGHGPMNLHEAIVVSCDTIFYRFAYEEWLRDGGVHPKKDPKDPMVHMARSYGFGAPSGIDLPSESSGRIPDRTWKKDFWELTKRANCKAAKTGYPQLERTDPSRAAYLKAIATENCIDGYVLRAGDAANFAVGQGDVLVTPLQLARAYAAIANGGKLVVPRLAKAVIRPDGTVAREFDPPKAPRLPVDGKVLTYLRAALADVPKRGTAAGAFSGFDLGKVPVAGKTGTAEVFGKADTSWFASYAPANDPRFAVVVMVSQAGQGAQVAAPAVREIYEAIFGLAPQAPDPNDPRNKNQNQNKAPGPALAGGKLPTKLPTIRPDGTVAAP